MGSSHNISSLDLLDSPTKICAFSLGAVVLGYLAVKGLNLVLDGKRSVHVYPPGPPRRWLVGAIGSFPTSYLYQNFSKWAEVYGTLNNIGLSMD